MPKLTGLQATREIREQAPDVAVLILSMYDDERYLFEALKAGASGYVLKTQADVDLLEAVRAVERGEPFLTPAAQQALIKDVLGQSAGRTDELTPREQEVVKLVAEAHTNKEIAEILHLSEKTVENHRSNAMRKLGMRDRVELVALRDPSRPDRAVAGFSDCRARICAAMLFSTKAEYGVRLMVELGRRAGEGAPETAEPVALGAVAEAELLPLSYLEHLVQSCARRGS